MHLLLDLRSIHKHMGGIGHAALNLALHLGPKGRGHRLTALLGPEAPADLNLHDFEILQVEAGMIDESFEQLRLPHLLEHMGVDLYLNPTFSLPALKTTRRQIAIIHDVVFEDHPEWVEPKLREYLRRWSRFSALHADAVVTVSDHARERILAVYDIPPKRVVRVYNGVALPGPVKPSPQEVDRILAKFGLERPYLLYLGSIEPKKGIVELLRAFARLVKEGFSGALAFAGARSGPAFDFEMLRLETGCADRIRLLGYVEESDKRCLLSSAHAFVYPSLYEGFGLPPLEAMALGVPCVVSDQTSLPEVAGDAAITVDVGDPEGFTLALRRALTDAEFRSRAKNEGPAQAARFTWDRAASEILGLCERVGGL